jgi:hypothetical protein
MGSVAEVFRWNSIGPDATVGVFIHPYGQDEFVAFSINVELAANEPMGAYSRIAAQQSDGLTQVHVDGLARTIWVQNQTIGPQPYISAGLMRFRQNS